MGTSFTNCLELKFTNRSSLTLYILLYAHYEVWGSTNVSSKGAEIEYLVTINLDILNVGNVFWDARRAEVT